MNQHTDFSEREKEVINLLLTGKSNKQIGHALGISTRTVEFHLGNIYTKLNVKSRSEAIIILSSKQLRESTGAVKGIGLGENTVEFSRQTFQNRGKSFFSKWSPSLKKQIYLGIGSFAVVILIILYILSQNNNNLFNEQSNATITQSNLSFSDTPTPGIAPPVASPTLTAREQILDKIYSLAADYDQTVNSEMQNGEVTTSTDPQTGQEVIRFEGRSMETISKQHDEFTQELRSLNEKYRLLYIAEIQPTPFPPKASTEENDQYYQQLVEQYPAFFDQVLKDGPTVRVFDPSEGIYFNMVIGEAYAKSEIMASAMDALRVAPQTKMVNQESDSNLIRQVMGIPNLVLSYIGIQPLANAPWIDAAIYSDDTGTKYWMAIEDNRLAQIEPPYAPEVPAIEVKSIDDVRSIAEQFANNNSPRYAELKSVLVYEQGNKGDIYFFTWSYRTRDWTGTDWIMMPPFLQIGLSADGKITTYINTLDLFH
jgi:DNA-binding CsgD family transcriptional regulator